MLTQLEINNLNDRRRYILEKNDAEFRMLILELDKTEAQTSHYACRAIAEIHRVLLPNTTSVVSDDLVVDSKSTVYRLLRKFSLAVRHLSAVEKQKARTDALRGSQMVSHFRIHPQAWMHIMSYGPQ